MKTTQQQNKHSTGLIATLVVLGLLLFFSIYINILIAPIYLIIHGLLVFGLLKINSFNSTLKPIKFGLLLSGLPLLLIILINLPAIPIYLATNSNVLEILTIIGLTLIVCLLDFIVVYAIYKRWWLPTQVDLSVVETNK